ncbi:hypothetical protein H1215_15520 [Anoxybacillus sp. LAT_38]|nr:hypothetical protein [Anoxybacillus sp. LAT_26]MCG6198582.1 hypothetical protein [Anoxybacillus sp. LAT_38]
MDTTVRTYQLTPEQLERLRNGENLDDILKDCQSMKEEKNMANKKIDLTVEEYVEMHKKGMSDAEIAKEKGITNQQLYSWKYFRKGHIRRALEQEAQQEIASTLEESETQVTSQETTVTEETQNNGVEEDDKGIEWLKREAIHAHKLLTEKEEECERLKHEIESWKELFETAMADKEQLHKENLILENQVQRLKEANDELKAQNERYFDTLVRLEQEVKGLRLYALQKLKIDVYGA